MCKDNISFILWADFIQQILRMQQKHYNGKTNIFNLGTLYMF